MNAEDKVMTTMVTLAANRGFVYPGSEIYGGLANAFDYGPYGVALKRNLKNLWWQRFVTKNPHNVGLDSAILMNPRTWVASGHVASFSDPLIDCKKCHARYRADNLVEDWNSANGIELNVEGYDNAKLQQYIREHEISCPKCGAKDFTDIRHFNLMFKTFQGVTEDTTSELYLRPETAQGIFVNFKNVQRTSRRKIPFGIAQIGKSFRNEITPGNFIFRTREFEQMELEFFCKPGTDLEWFNYWRSFCVEFLHDLGISQSNLRLRDHDADELSFYSKATTDIEYRFPFGWGELWGIADRTDYDLKCHMNESHDDLRYFDPYDNEKYLPYVIEPSLGADRLFLMVFCEAYDEETLENGETRVVLRFKPEIAPVKIAVLPLSGKLSEAAYKIYEKLLPHYAVEFDDKQSIGKRYRRQDEIGTPYCVTFDFASLDDNAVTVRERDSMEQERISVDELQTYFADKF